MNPNDELRSAYKQFLASPTGKDFLTRIVAYETDLQLQLYRPGATNEQKTTNIDRMSGLYWVRALLDDLSKPKPTVTRGRKITPSGPQ